MCFTAVACNHFFSFCGYISSQAGDLLLLDLSQCCLTDGVLRAFWSLVHSKLNAAPNVRCSLQALELDRNLLQDEGARTLCELIGHVGFDHLVRQRLRLGLWN
jgi:hypothetical protein